MVKARPSELKSKSEGASHKGKKTVVHFGLFIDKING